MRSAASGLYAVYRLAIRRPSLEFDSNGITAPNVVGVGRLSWDEVDHVVLYNYYGQAMLGIVPRDFDGFVSRQRVIRRSLIKISLALGCTPISVPQVWLSVKLADLARRFETEYGMRVESR